ncbi:bifunctional GNAT family N-acetyltransferase/hotdog fold thioesterase [Thalassotalea sp. PLHSN55]|uniref:bifunctional GNAT family N-acetyltransferase/hotdog fold thioesterase n=1 Tax=Thalassotalea sp. PLHSN55 TaxID=3435888 RepID=UPI003F85F466
MIECRAPISEQELQQYYHLRWRILRQPWQQPEGSEQDELEQQSYHRILVDENNTIVAVARLHLVSQHQAQIRYMAVAEQAQGKGFGRQILIALEQLALTLGCCEISLNARENALGFYQSLDYQNQGFSHQLYQSIKHFKMIKTISHLKQSSKEVELAKQLQATWHQTILMSKAMNVEVCHFDGETMQTSCDLVFNKNLHNTMFAGSIYTLATLTGWGWVYCQLELAGYQGDIVLADANIRYHAPLHGVAIARTSVNLVKGSAHALASSKKARFNITVEVLCGEHVVATFSGLYVALAK